MMAGIKVGRAWSAVGVLILAILMISATKASACFVVGVASPTATTAVTTEFDGDAHLRGGDQIHGPNASAGMGRQGREHPGGFRDEHAASWSGVAAGDAVAAVPRLAVEYVYDGGAASYDASARRVDVRTVVHVDGAGRPTNAMSLRRQSGAVLHGSVSVSGFVVAAKSVEAGSDVVRYDAKFASRNLFKQTGDGYAVTPGGRTVSAHAADRIVIGAPGRAPSSLSSVDHFLDSATRTSYNPFRDTVKVQGSGRSYVVVSGTGAPHIVTVMIP